MRGRRAALKGALPLGQNGEMRAWISIRAHIHRRLVVRRFSLVRELCKPSSFSPSQTPSRRNRHHASCSTDLSRRQTRRLRSCVRGPGPRTSRTELEPGGDASSSLGLRHVGLPPRLPSSTVERRFSAVTAQSSLPFDRFQQRYPAQHQGHTGRARRYHAGQRDSQDGNGRLPKVAHLHDSPAPYVRPRARRHEHEVSYHTDRSRRHALFVRGAFLLLHAGHRPKTPATRWVLLFLHPNATPMVLVQRCNTVVSRCASLWCAITRPLTNNWHGWSQLVWGLHWFQSRAKGSSFVCERRLEPEAVECRRKYPCTFESWCGLVATVLWKSDQRVTLVLCYNAWPWKVLNFWKRQLKL